MATQTAAQKVKDAVKAKTAGTAAAAKGAEKAPAEGEKKAAKRNKPDVVLAGLLERRAATVEKYEKKLKAIDDHIAALKDKKKVMPKDEAAKQLAALGVGTGDAAKASIAAKIKELQALAKAADVVTDEDLAAVEAGDESETEDEGGTEE